MNIIFTSIGIIVPVLIFRHLKNTNLAPFCIFSLVIYFIAFFYINSLFLSNEYINTVIAGEKEIITVILCLIISILFLYKMPNKSTLGLKYLTQILSFKKFIESAQKEELKEVLLKDNDYFSKTLPFAYAIGLLDIWIIKFELMEQKSLNYIEGEITSASMWEFVAMFADLIMPSSLNGGF